MVALESIDKLCGHFAGKEWILAPGFLSAPPTRVAENVDIRRPEGQPLELVISAIATQGFMIFGAALSTDGSGDLVDQIPVPGGSHANCLRKNGGAPVGGHAVQSFAPKVVVRNAQTRHALRRMVHHPDFFIEGQAGEQILNSFSNGKIGVKVSRLGHKKSSIR